MSDQLYSSNDSNSPIIDCRGIYKWFGDFEALHDITLSVETGSVVCIIGPSGSGKSTFLRTLNGLESFDEGSIVINNIRLPGVKNDIRKVRRNVGMVFQSFNLFPHLTVLKNLTISPVTASGISRMEAEERSRTLLTRVGIVDQINKYPEQLSGGQQQRVAIARALAMEPRELLFDEPTSALDNETEQAVMNAIDDLGEEITILIIAHRLTTLKGCDKIIKLEKDYAVRIGTYEEVINE